MEVCWGVGVGVDVGVGVHVLGCENGCACGGVSVCWGVAVGVLGCRFVGVPQVPEGTCVYRCSCIV